MADGLFITFEGGEGTGKSTQIALLAENLASRGVDVVTTREPGGTPAAEAVRSLLVSGATDRWSAEAEALLNYAARDSHLNQVIRPALRRGAWVISDRFIDSTYVYQGSAGDCSLGFIDQLCTAIVGETLPDLTFILDLDPTVGLARASERSNQAEDRYERKGPEFHATVRSGFLDRARDNPARCCVIDAGRTIAEIAAEIAEIVASRAGD